MKAVNTYLLDTGVYTRIKNMHDSTVLEYHRSRWGLNAQSADSWRVEQAFGVFSVQSATSGIPVLAGSFATA